MTHNAHTDSDAHRELDTLGLIGLARLVKNWDDPFEPPMVVAHGRFRVVRDDLFEFGTKARAAAAVLAQPEYRDAETIVYVAPRAGWAAISLAKLCQLQGRRLVLFCPASNVISHHQRVAHELGAELRFMRVAAMPNLQTAARLFAHQHHYTFFPLGLAVPSAVAGLAKVARQLRLRQVREVWCAASTGVLTRALQVAWPDAIHHVVAVARNLKAGEKGRAIVHSHPSPFLRDAPLVERPPYPSASNYDAKIWQFSRSLAAHDAVIWNVAGELEMEFSKPVPRSDRAWGDDQDLRKP